MRLLGNHADPFMNGQAVFFQAALRVYIVEHSSTCTVFLAVHFENLRPSQFQCKVNREKGGNVMSTNRPTELKAPR